MGVRSLGIEVGLEYVFAVFSGVLEQIMSIDFLIMQFMQVSFFG